jgi:two-component system sensor histidine kinase TctE
MLSLRECLLWWLLLPLAVFVVIAGAMSYDTARRTADLVHDNMLVSSARTIVEDVDWEGGALVARIPPAALEIFASPEHDRVFYRVVTGCGRLLAGSPDLALPDARATHPVFYDTTLAGLPVRAVAYERQLYDAGTTEAVTVVVGKTQASRDMMVKALWHPQLLRLLLMLVFAMGLVYLGLTFELRPLMKLRSDVADRKPMELEPIHTERLHSEMRPIVDAINQCISRLNLHAVTQRQFIADAAHQLRTPITVLDSQIQYARQREGPDLALKEVLVCMQRSSRKM